MLVPDDVGLPVGEFEDVALELIVDDGVFGGVTVALNDVDDVPLSDPPKLKVLVGVALKVFETLIVVDPLKL